MFSGLGGDEQPLSDLGVGQPCTDQLQHLALARGERGGQLASLLGSRRPVSPEPAQHRRRSIPGDRRAESFEARECCPGGDDGTRRVAHLAEHLGELEAHQPELERTFSGGEVPGGTLERLDRGGAVAKGDEDTAFGDGGVGAEHHDVRVGRECGELLGGRPCGVDVATLQFDIDEQREERAGPDDVTDHLLAPSPQDGRGEVELAAHQVDPGERTTTGDVILERRQQIGRFLDPPLLDAQVGEVSDGQRAMGDVRTVGRSERLHHQRLGLRPLTGRAEHRSVGDAAMNVQHPRLIAGVAEDGLDDARPLLGAAHVADPIAGRQHRAERDAGGDGADLARRDRGERGVEPGESLAHPSLRNQRQAAVGHRLHLEVGVGELERDRQRPIGARQQRIDVGSIAGHVRELEISPLDARPDPTEHRSGPFRPTLPGRDVAEHAHVQPGEIDRHPRCRAELTGFPEQPERRLPVAECVGGSIVHVVQAADDLMRDRQPIDLERGQGCRLRCLEVTCTQRISRGVQQLVGCRCHRPTHPQPPSDARPYCAARRVRSVRRWRS